MAIKNVRLRVLEITSDRQQYKPYSHKLGADNLFVDVPLDEGEIIADGKTVVLTIDGFAAVLGEIADAIETMHEEYRKSKFG